jgi:hypothetical protein
VGLVLGGFVTASVFSFGAVPIGVSAYLIGSAAVGLIFGAVLLMNKQDGVEKNLLNMTFYALNTILAGIPVLASGSRRGYNCCCTRF